MNSIVRHTQKSILAYLLICTACFLMLKTIVPHLSLGSRVGFLLEKQAYIHNPIWRFAFYTHVFSSILTLPSLALLIYPEQPTQALAPSAIYSPFFL